jgi:hypothetical protein
MTSGLEMYSEMLSVFEDRPETWQLEHRTAMACRDLEDILAVFNPLFIAIQKAGQRDWGPNTQDHVARYASIEKLYRQWRDAGRVMQMRVQRLSDDYTVEGSEDLVKNLEEAEKFLRDADRAAVVEERTGLRDRTLTPDAADQLSRILEGRAGTSFRPKYEPKSVPLANISDIREKQ